MKRAYKILTLILIVVFTLSVFAGCNLVGRNIAQYRNAEAFSIGSEKVEKVTIGKLLDTFNSYYNNYYYYISSGYLQTSDLLEMVVSSLIQQYMQINDYTTTHDALTDLTDLQRQIHNAEYLTKDQFGYAVKYVNYLAYTAFDQYTEQNISAKYDLEAEETEDTSRDFTEYDELTDMYGEVTDSYAIYTRDKNFVNEDANDFFDDNYPYLVDGEGDDEVTAKLNLDSYVYDLNDAEQKTIAEERVKSYNDRLTDDEKEAEKSLTVEEYVEILADTKKQYEETVQNNYGVPIDEFLKSQLADMVSSCILALWSYDVYKDLEADADLQQTLSDNYDLLAAAQLADFNVSDNFDSFITSLGTDSLIYNVPAEADNYVFVKNILIPFTADKTALLTNLAKNVGDESEAYISKRNEFATELVAEYFKSDKYDEETEALFDTDNTLTEKKGKTEDEDSRWYTKEKVVVNQDGKLAINPDGILSTWLRPDGTVQAMEGKTATETIVELMKRFNTDTAQHTAKYDYVVYVGEDWEDYDHSWVKEFYTAVNEMTADQQYTLCASAYGVHIIYKSGKVADRKFTFDFTKHTDTSDPNYTLFQNYFDTQMNLLTQDALENLQKSKLGGDYSEYISISGGLNKFLKDNGFEFDFDAFIKELVAEL